jgi:uncharacterized protein (TIGR02145 family)
VITYPATVGPGSAGQGIPAENNLPPDGWGCLSLRPNPAWFFMQIGDPGLVTIYITNHKQDPPAPPNPQDNDIDFICWGPYTSPTGACTNDLTPAHIIDCSYSGEHSETCTILNAQTGEFYLLCITNFDNTATDITFSQSNFGQVGAGNTNCNIVLNCSVLSITTEPTTCDPGTGTFTLNGTIEFTNPPATGVLLLKDVTASPIMQTQLVPPFISPMNYSIPNIPCDGLLHTLVASFSDAVNPCNLDSAYQAPIPPCPSGVISGGGPVCNDGTSQTNVSIAVVGAAGPYNFTYAINGVNQPPVTNYAGSLPYIINTNTPGTYTLISTSNSSCSGSSSGSATISLVPIPVAPVPVNPANYSCGNDRVPLLVTDIPGVAVNWYDAASGGIKLFTGNPFLTPVLTATTTFYAEAESITGNCKSLTRTPLTAEVRPVPAVSNASTSMSICSGEPWSVPLTSTPAGASFNWTAGCLPIGSVSGFVTPAAGNILSDPLINTTTGPGVVKYQVTPTLNQCDGIPVPFNITVNPKPIPAFVQSSASVCEGAQSVIYSTHPGMTNYLWSISSGGTITSGQTTNTVEVNWSVVGSGTDRWIEVNYTDANGCVAENPTRIYVTVKPIPNVVATPSTLDICSGQTAAIQFESTVAGTIGSTQFNWTLTAGTGVSPNTLSGSGTINQAFTSVSSAIEPVLFQITPLANGCSPANPAPYTLNVKPVPNLTTAPISPLCSGNLTNINLLSSVAGTQFTWTASVLSGSATGQTNSVVPGVLINDQLINTGNDDAVIRYTIIPHANGCNGISYNYDVTVHPVPLLTNSPKLKEICQGNATAITLTSNVTGSQFTWTCAQPSGNVTGWANSSTPGTTIDQILQLAIFTLDSVIYHITPSASGCFGLDANYKVIVNPVPRVTNTPMHDTICSATQANVALTATCAGTSFSWSGALGTGNITGFGTGNTPLISETLINHGNTTGSVIYTVIPHAGLCLGSDTLYTVYVYPKPGLTTAPLNTTICSGTLITIPLTSNVANASYSWTASASSASVAGFGPGNGTNITQTITNSGTTIETVTYTITPRANGCNGDNFTYIVTVNPVPHLMNSQPDPVCSGTTLNIPLIPDVTGSTFTWNASCLPVGSVTGFTANQATGINVIAETLTNTGNIVSTVTYLITPHANGCSGSIAGLTLPVNPSPVISCSAGQSICSGTAFTPITLNSTVAGTLFSWSASCPVGSINPCPIAPGTGSPVPSVTFMNVTDIQQTITYSVNSSFNGCPGSSTTHVVTVNPSPTVTNWPLEQTICSGQTSIKVNLTSTVLGTTFSWTASTTAPITGFSLAGSDNIPAQTLSIPTGNTGFVTYHIIPSFTGGTSCPGAPTDYKIHVNSLPTPVITGPTLVCELQPDVKYATPNVPGHSFNWIITGATSVINAGTNEVTVTWGPYTTSPGTLVLTETIDATGCQQTTVVTHVVLQQRPIPTLTGPESVCIGSTNKIYQTEPGMSNYAWSVTGGSITAGGGAGSPSATVTWNTVGTQTIEVNYTNSLNCPGFPAKQLIVTVNPLPNTVISQGSGPVCESMPHTYQVPADPASSFLWTITPATRGIVSAGQGNSNISIDWYTSGGAVVAVTGTNTTTGCISSSTFPVIVNPKPSPVFTGCFDLTTTPNAKKIILRGGNPALSSQGVYSGNRVSLNNISGQYEFDPTGASAGSYPITYTYTNTFGCPASASPVSITITNNTFFCGGKLTDVRDGRQYQTATLSGRCWMTENLGYGAILPNVPATPQTDNCVVEKYCLPADAGCTSNGGLYQWDELLDYSASASTKGICPPEWHVPSETEWQQLIDNLVPGIGAPNANAAVSPELKDIFLTGGFHGLLTGFNYLDNTWVFNSGPVTATMYWTSTASNMDHSTSRGLNIYTPSISRYSGSRANSFPVRCVKD